MAQAQVDVLTALTKSRDPMFYARGEHITATRNRLAGTDMTAIQDAQRRALMAVGNMQLRGRQAAASPLAGARLLQAPAFSPMGGTAATKMLLGQ